MSCGSTTSTVPSSPASTKSSNPSPLTSSSPSCGSSARSNVAPPSPRCIRTVARALRRRAAAWDLARISEAHGVNSSTPHRTNERAGREALLLRSLSDVFAAAGEGDQSPLREGRSRRSERARQSRPSRESRPQTTAAIHSAPITAGARINASASTDGSSSRRVHEPVPEPYEAGSDREAPTPSTSAPARAPRPVDAVGQETLDPGARQLLGDQGTKHESITSRYARPVTCDVHYTG